MSSFVSIYLNLFSLLDIICRSTVRASVEDSIFLNFNGVANLKRNTKIIELNRQKKFPKCLVIKFRVVFFVSKSNI